MDKLEGDVVARESQFFRVDANRLPWNTLSLLSRPLCSGTRPSSWSAGGRRNGRGGGGAGRGRGGRVHAEAAGGSWSLPVQLLLMMSLHFVSGSLGRCLRVV